MRKNSLEIKIQGFIFFSHTHSSSHKYSGRSNKVTESKTFPGGLGFLVKLCSLMRKCLFTAASDSLIGVDELKDSAPERLVGSVE